MPELASLNLKLPSTLKNDFTQTAEASRHACCNGT